MYPLSRCYCCPLQPPSRCPLTNYAAVPRLSCWLVAHKTHSSKSTNGFRYEMHETDRQTYCAAFLPHRVRVPPTKPPPPPSSNPPLCATYIRSHNQLAIFLLTPTLSSSLSLLPVVICDMSSSSKCCFYQPPLVPLCFYATADWGYLALLKLVLWKGYTQYPYATHELRVSHPFILYADTRGMPRPLPPLPLPPAHPLSLAYQNAYCTLDKILARHFSFNMQLGNSASKLKLVGGRMLAGAEEAQPAVATWLVVGNPIPVPIPVAIAVTRSWRNCNYVALTAKCSLKEFSKGSNSPNRFTTQCGLRRM